MKIVSHKSIVLFLLLVSGILSVKATPSTIIWIPSVDFQSYNTFHLGIDNYYTVFKKGVAQGGVAFPTDLGTTAGVLSFSNIQVEAGFDLMEPQDSPWSFNAKVGAPEGVFAEWSPAIALGGYNFGVKKNITDMNLLYALASKTFPVVGRISAGFYTGNKNVLVDASGKADNSGILFSWDRVVTEIDDRLWVAVDYQGGKNFLGALNVGFAWSFSKNVSIIFARDFYNNGAPATFTTQLDINI